MPDLSCEQKAFDEGATIIAAIDEVGRGCIAGPVVACAVIMPRGLIIPGVADSKKLSEKKRTVIAEQIKAEAIGFAFGVIPAQVIDEINILQATFCAMRQALEGLAQLAPDHILVDGNMSIPHISVAQTTIVGGDNLSHSIAAASILAKVARDKMMAEFDVKFPGYGLAGHKGYGTKAHYEAIRSLGPCEIHRMSFAGVVE